MDGEMENAHTMLNGKLKGKTPLRGDRHRWENI
jgi:hypothetical protein